MYRVRYYLKCAVPLLFFLPLLGAAEAFFGAFYSVYNALLLFFLFSCVHNLFNKRLMARNMVIVDIAVITASVAALLICGWLRFDLYSGAKAQGILILICLNQLFMYSRNNYRERAAVRQGIF